jgi:hypothetical protein
MNAMSGDQEELTYTLSTDEVAARLSLSPRHVRRMGLAGILKGEVQNTSKGKQWFFNEEDVETLRVIRERIAEKEARQQIAKDTFGHTSSADRGRPQTAEDMSLSEHPTSKSLRRPQTAEDMSVGNRALEAADLARVAFIEKTLSDEREEHAKTKTKLGTTQQQLLDQAQRAARLEGEKEGFQAGYQKVIDEQTKFIGMLAEKLKLQFPSSPDTLGHATGGDPRRPGTRRDMSEETSEVPLTPYGEEPERDSA